MCLSLLYINSVQWGEGVGISYGKGLVLGTSHRWSHVSLTATLSGRYYWPYFNRWGNEDTERLSSLFKSTEWVSDGAAIQTQICVTLKLKSLRPFIMLVQRYRTEWPRFWGKVIILNILSDRYIFLFLVILYYNNYILYYNIMCETLLSLILTKALPLNEYDGLISIFRQRKINIEV